MATPASSKPTSVSLAHLGIYTPVELDTLCAQTASQQYLVHDYIARKSLTLGVGDSGLGKSPFFYQGALCIAAGISFLGLPTERGRVLYCDNENSPDEVAHMVDTMARYLQLPAKPDDLLLFNKNNAPKDLSVADLIKNVQPDLIILDPIYAWYPEIEDNQKAVTAAYSELRDLMKRFDCAVIGVHHPTKEPQGAKVTPRERLDQIADVKRWFVRSRGSGAMVNGCDCRLAFDTPSAPAGDCKLVVGGYRRMRGSFPLVRLTRELDPEGDVQGYRRLCGLALLKPTWKATYAALPVEFRFKDAKALLRDSSDETASFVKACVAAGVLRHDPAVPPKGLYRKILPGSSTVPPAVQTGDHADFAATVQ